MLGKYLNPRNDAAFKRLFGTERNKELLLALLNEVLGTQLKEPLRDIRFLTPFQEPKAWAHKESIVDVLCRDKEGTQYIIEMQVAHRDGFQERAQYYASKAFVAQMYKGGRYEHLKEVIFLAFCDFPIFARQEHYKSEHVTLDRKTGQHHLNKINFTFIDLPKFDEQRGHDLEGLTLEEKFYYFLRHADEVTPQQLEVLVAGDVVIRQAYHELDRFYWTPEELAQYEAEEKREMDHAAAMRYATRRLQETREEAITEGKQEGRKEGRQERNKEIAKELLTRGMDLQAIAEVTGLTPAQVKPKVPDPTRL